VTEDETRNRGDEGGVPAEEGPRRVAPPVGFVPVVDEMGTLLFFYDPERDLVQIRARGRTTLVDLRMHRAGGRGVQGKVV
jgi:hypothetical protein